MNDPREILYKKETDYLENDRLEIDDDEEIQNALKEIEKYEHEISRLKEQIKQWRKERFDIIHEKKRIDLMNGVSKRKLLEFNNNNENFDKNNINLKKMKTISESANTKLMKQILPANEDPFFKTAIQQQKFMLRKVHSFYNDELFDNNRDNNLKFKTQNVDERCDFSKKKLSLRYIPKDVVERILTNYTVLSLNKLFQLVRPPDYTLPYSNNYAIVGIVHELTPIKITQKPIFNKERNISIDDYSSLKTKTKYSQNSSQMVNKHFNIRLTDLKQMVVITLHGQELIKEYYNSLKPGDLIMIDSPTTFKYNSSYEKYGFGLSITEECGRHQIMEIGKVSSYSKCERLNRPSNSKETHGTLCGMFYDNTIQKCCDYHQEKEMESGLSRRMELNSGYLGRRISHQEKQKNIERRDNYGEYNPSKGVALNKGGIIGVPDKTSIRFRNDLVASKFFNTSNEFDDDVRVKIDPRVKEQIRKEKRDNILLLKKLTDKNKDNVHTGNELNKQSKASQRDSDRKNNAIMMLKAAVNDKRSSKSTNEKKR